MTRHRNPPWERARERQNYRFSSDLDKCCGRCQNRSDDTELRCTIGGFATYRFKVCDRFKEAKQTEAREKPSRDDMRPQVAWCWASGLIEIGGRMPPNGPNGGGAIQIASGPKANLEACLGALARHGKGASAGKLIVPGVPEANGQQAKGDALAAWLAWCSSKRALDDGVVFAARRP
jgi:hypothetical protein